MSSFFSFFNSFFAAKTLEVRPKAKLLLNPGEAGNFTQRLCVEIRNKSAAAVTIREAGFLLKGASKTKISSSEVFTVAGAKLPVRLEARSLVSAYMSNLFMQNADLIAGAYSVTGDGKEYRGSGKIEIKHDHHEGDSCAH